MLNKGELNGKVDTVWRQELQMDSVVRPAWTVFFKPPLKKKTGGLQWRILHGAIAVNVFVSVSKPAVSCTCPFLW